MEPFANGIQKRPGYFQKIMNHGLFEMINNGCRVYLDDIVIYGKTQKEHNERLIKVLKILKNKNFKINNDKIQLNQKEINLLGMVVNGSTIRIPDDKKDNILEYKIPKTKKDLQRFLGAINHHRLFIDNITRKTEILTDMLKDDKSMNEWSKSHTESFLALQNEAYKTIIRYHPYR